MSLLFYANHISHILLNLDRTCPPGWKEPQIGKCYKVYYNSFTYNEAVAVCAKEGAILMFTNNPYLMNL